MTVPQIHARFGGLGHRFYVNSRFRAVTSR